MEERESTPQQPKKKEGIVGLLKGIISTFKSTKKIPTMKHGLPNKFYFEDGVWKLDGKPIEDDSTAEPPPKAVARTRKKGKGIKKAYVSSFDPSMIEDNPEDNSAVDRKQSNPIKKESIDNELKQEVGGPGTDGSRKEIGDLKNELVQKEAENNELRKGQTQLRKEKELMKKLIQELKTENEEIRIANEENMEKLTNLCNEIEFRGLEEIEDLQYERDLYCNQVKELSSFKAKSVLELQVLQDEIKYFKAKLTIALEDKKNLEKKVNTLSKAELSKPSIQLSTEKHEDTQKLDYELDTELKITQLQNEIAQLKETNYNLSTKNISLEGSLKHLNQENSQSNQKHSKLTQSNEYLKNSNSTLQKTIQQLKEQLQRSQQGYDQSQLQLNSQKLENSNLQTTIESYKSQLNKIKKELDSAKAFTQKQQSESKNYINQLKTSKEALEQDFGQINSRLQTIEKENSKLRNSKAELQQNIQSLQNENMKLEAIFQEKEALKSNGINDQMQSLEAEIRGFKNLQEEMIQSDEANDEARKEFMQQFQSQNQKLNSEKLRLERKIINFEADLQSICSITDSLYENLLSYLNLKKPNSINKTIRMTLENIFVLVNKVKTKCSSLQKLNLQNEQSAAKLKEEINILQLEKKEHLLQITKLKENQINTERTKELEEGLEKAKLSIKQKMQNIAELENQLEIKKNEAKQVLIQNKKIQIMNEKLEKENENIKCEIEKDKEILQKTQIIVKDLESQIKTSKSQKLELEVSFKEIENQLNHKISQLSEIEKKNDASKTEILEKDAKLIKLGNTIKDLLQQKEQQNILLKKLENSNSELSSNLKLMQNNYESKIKELTNIFKNKSQERDQRWINKTEEIVTILKQQRDSALLQVNSISEELKKSQESKKNAETEIHIIRELQESLGSKTSKLKKNNFVGENLEKDEKINTLEETIKTLEDKIKQERQDHISETSLLNSSIQKQKKNTSQLEFQLNDLKQKEKLLNESLNRKKEKKNIWKKVATESKQEILKFQEIEIQLQLKDNKINELFELLKQTELLKDQLAEKNNEKDNKIKELQELILRKDEEIKGIESEHKKQINTAIQLINQFHNMSSKIPKIETLSQIGTMIKVFQDYIENQKAEFIKMQNQVQILLEKSGGNENNNYENEINDLRKKLNGVLEEKEISKNNLTQMINQLIDENNTLKENIKFLERELGKKMKIKEDNENEKGEFPSTPKNKPGFFASLFLTEKEQNQI